MGRQVLAFQNGIDPIPNKYSASIVILILSIKLLTSGGVFVLLFFFELYC